MNQLNTFTETVEEYREKYIPKQYNQAHLLDHLTNPDIDHYISISNRSDGKSFNYIGALLYIAHTLDIKLLFVVRKHYLRHSIVELLEKITSTITYFKPEELDILSNQHYLTVMYNKKVVAIITDLSKASDLKLFSSLLKEYPIIIYEEFLALEGDYLPNEWVQLKTIYQSVNRVEKIPYIHIPKILYLGNPVNFSSPILSNLNLFNILETHKIDTLKQYNNIMIEVYKNENANEIRNLRAFDEYKDDMTQAKFVINKHDIANETDRDALSRDRYFIYIRLRDAYLRIDYNLNTSDIIILSVVGYLETYSYCEQLQDKREDVIFLNDKYYDMKHIKKYDNGLYLYDNQYTKEYLENNGYLNLRVDKIITEHMNEMSALATIEREEIKYNDNYLENTKKRIFERFNGI